MELICYVLPLIIMWYHYRRQPTKQFFCLIEQPVKPRSLLFPSGDCSRCNVTANSVGYLEDVCDCSKYYQCQRIGHSWTAYHRHCAACLRWDQTTLTCSIRIAGCTVPTTTPNPGTPLYRIHRIGTAIAFFLSTAS